MMDGAREDMAPPLEHAESIRVPHRPLLRGMFGDEALEVERNASGGGEAKRADEQRRGLPSLAPRVE